MAHEARVYVPCRIAPTGVEVLDSLAEEFGSDRSKVLRAVLGVGMGHLDEVRTRLQSERT